MSDSVIEILKQFRRNHKLDLKETEAGRLARAISEIMPLMQKREHIMALEYTWQLGSYTEQKVAVFDDRKVSGEDVRSCICKGESYHPCVAFMSKTQFDNLFPCASEECQDPMEDILPQSDDITFGQWLNAKEYQPPPGEIVIGSYIDDVAGESGEDARVVGPVYRNEWGTYTCWHGYEVPVQKWMPFPEDED